MVEQKTKLEYQQGFRNLSMELNYVNTFKEWAEYYKKILNWEIKFDKVLIMSLQIYYNLKKKKPTFSFLNLYRKKKNYEEFGSSTKTIMSHTAFKEKVKPVLEKDKVFTSDG